MKHLCAVVGMSRDAFYKRLRRRAQDGGARKVVLELVRDVRKEEPRTGTRKLLHRISPELGSLGVSIGRDRLFDLLREKSLLVKRKRRYQRTTYSNHQYAVAPNRVKNREITAPGQVFVSDITYIRLKREFAYLFLVTDAYSRKVVGWHLSRDLSHYSALLALDLALESLTNTRGVIHHSDRGCQYCCNDFLNYLGEHGVIPSMTDESHCYQNAIAERLNGILKDEFDLDVVFPAFSEARVAVEHAIDVYNNKRTHWSLQLKTPAQVHQEAA